MVDFPVEVNTAVELLLDLEADPCEKIILKIQEDVSLHPIEVNIESRRLAKQNHNDGTELPSLKQLWQR